MYDARQGIVSYLESGLDMSDSVLGNPRRTILRSDDLFRRRSDENSSGASAKAAPASEGLLEHAGPAVKTALMVLVTCLSLRCDLAAGQSFDCRKASSSTEKAICASAELSALDSRMTTAWKKSTEIFTGPEAEGMDVTLRNEQREWLGKRNACGGDMSCLRFAYQQRTAVLEFRPFPEAAPVDRFVGKFDHQGFMSVFVQRLDANSARVLIEGAEPKTARWLCHFEGIGTVRENRLEVIDAETEHRLLLEQDGSGILIPNLDSNLEANFANCGLNGMMNFKYRRSQ